MYKNVFIHSLANGNLDCIHLGDITNEIAVNIPIQIFLRKDILNCLEKFLRVSLLRRMVNISLTFQETVKKFLKMIELLTKNE